MMNLTPTQLDLDWQYQLSRSLETEQALKSDWAQLKQLEMWDGKKLSSYPVAYLRRLFDLQPIDDVCIRYWLHIDHAPDETQVWINAFEAGQTWAGEAFRVDVTDYISLENNEILLRVYQQGSIGKLWLEPVPCEPPH
ncbi:MAG: hypothetical protein K8L97_09520 [Anaerolineae bacterium]|nr:hypothetical protein [Anaerolineae bacterium]